MDTNIKLRPGRPKGSKNGVSVRKWQPKSWKFEYETVLLLHICGKSYGEISETCQISEPQIGNILNSELCRVRKEQLKSKLGVTEVLEGYKDIMNTSRNRMKEFLDNADVFKAMPVGAVSVAMKMFEMFDSRVNPPVVKAPISPTGINNGVINNNTIFLATEEAVARLTKADAFSQAVMDIHGKRIAEISSDRNITGPGI